ncbi:IclR family transcriptional regulator [Nesterenkonia halophila]|uniref:IclR family transcriptional regulator n=1 Tax=Nesterenkonia halophila TaxID=302044 RepID=UPI001291DFEC|nr:IclR family transcriptional regulator [Nesterenkonia halophila]
MNPASAPAEHPEDGREDDARRTAPSASTGALAAAAPTTAESSTTVRSVDRALQILHILARDGEATLSAMARELGVHKSTVGRLVETLAGHDMIEPPTRADGFHLGVGCLRLAGATAARLDLSVEAQPVCDRLSAEVGETTNVAITRDGVAINVCQSQGASAVAMRNWIGQQTALHATSSGKVLLAHLPADQRQDVVAAGLDAFTAHTLDAAHLDAELGAIRGQGFAEALEEYEEGLNAVGAPVLDHSGEVVAAISAAGPAYRLPSERLPEIRTAVLHAAAELSRRMGHPGGAD